MVVIRINARLNADNARAVIEGIHNQARTGIIVVPEYCELLSEVPADEEIKVITEDLCKKCGYKIHSERVAAQNDCNDCGKKRTCQYVPPVGTFTRINCPLWRPE